MSTRAHIGIEYPDGTVKHCYIHNDGGRFTARQLLQSYNTSADAEALVSFGSRSHLAMDVIPYDDSDKVCVSKDRYNYFADTGWDIEYLYLFSNGCWNFMHPGVTMQFVDSGRPVEYAQQKENWFKKLESTENVY